jgi:hypothetical protein
MRSLSSSKACRQIWVAGDAWLSALIICVGKTKHAWHRVLPQESGNKLDPWPSGEPLVFVNWHYWQFHLRFPQIFAMGIAGIPLFKA